MPRPSYPLHPGALQRLLDDRGVTVQQVADAAGLHPRTVGNAVGDRYRGVQCATALGLLIAFDARPSELLAVPTAALEESPQTVRRRRGMRRTTQ